MAATKTLKDLAAEVSAVDVTTEPGSEPAPENMTEYRVIGGAIAPQGNGSEHPDGMFQPGEIVLLTAAEAKHYNKLGRLAPVIED